MPFYEIQRENLNAVIQANQLKRWWVAEYSGIHRSTLRRWISGKVVRARHSNVRAVATLLEVPVEQFARLQITSEFGS